MASTITNASIPRDQRSGHSKQALLSEDEFVATLHREKRRTERSGNSLLLALVHLDGPRWSAADGHLRRAVTHSVCSAVRDTDTAGWYRNDAVLGVIFVELRESMKSAAQDSVDMRLKQVLRRTSNECVEDIHITYEAFPEKDGSLGSGDPIICREGAPITSKGASIMKRCMDLTGSLIGLLAAAPLLLLIAAAVKLTSQGPVFYRQTRVGEGGRLFTLFKVRTMFRNSDSSLHRAYVVSLIEGDNIAQAHRAGAAIYKIVNDPRVTPIGRILRRSSLDELPQFLNVLKGDMSLVGPRPPLPYEFDRYSAWHRRRILEVRPGLTGLWQVIGRGRTTFDEMVRLDLWYASQWSLWLDLKILLKTPAAVISGGGAY